VLLSSADVYPDSSSPLSTLENQNLDPAAMTPYGFHKYLAELCVRHAAKRWLVIRGGGFVGPFMKKNAIYDILHGGPLWLHADSELQYIHTEQAAAMVLQLVDRDIVNEVFNLSATGTVKLSEVIHWTKSSVSANPDSPRFRCELNLAKISGHLTLPETSSVVREFVASCPNL
jgi:nucleoside-diphosphate-sugar epimerase